jgi:hypothetical protein
LGIFKTLFDLRLKAHNRPFEDYLTEIISFVLSRDLDLFNNFLNHFKLTEHQVESFDITTQLSLKKIKNHKTDSRPDMAVFLDGEAIFFENKVDSEEGDEQLKKYAEHLEGITDGRKTLVYITKYYDIKNPENIFENCNSKINFISIRWYNIYRFFKAYKSDPIVFELLLFMKQNNLSMNNQFNPSDIITLTNFTNVRKMMDESMFGEVSTRFKEINKTLSQKSASMTQLRDNDRYIYYSFHKKNMLSRLGYWMNSKNEKDYPDIGVEIVIEPQSSCRDNVISTFKTIVENNTSWNEQGLSNPKAWAKITYQKSLQSFLSEENQIEEIKKFFMIGLDEMERIFIENPNLPKN